MKRSVASWLLVGVGVVALLVGFGALFSNAAKLKWLVPIVAGGVLLVIGAKLEDLTEIGVSAKALQVKFGIGKAAASVIERLGLEGEVYTYQFIHKHLGADADRSIKVRLQDLLVEDAKVHAFAHHVEKSDVTTLFKENHPAARVLGIGLVQGNTGLGSDEVYLKAIGESQSANEQYQGLVLAEKNWPTLSQEVKSKICSLIESNPHIRADEDRRVVGERIRALWTSDSAKSVGG